LFFSIERAHQTMKSHSGGAWELAIETRL